MTEALVDAMVADIETFRRAPPLPLVATPFVR